MALFIKHDFTPPLFSGKWFAIKCRRNMLLQCRNHILSILESGLLFREDSAKVEQEAPPADELWMLAGGGKAGWLTRGERILSVLTVGAAVAICPPKPVGFHRRLLVHISIYAAFPLAIRIGHRLMGKGTTLKTLLEFMKDYLTLVRRTMACVKEYKLLNKGLGSVSTMLESTLKLLWRQQTDLSLLMARSSSALLGNFPWLYEDVDWDAVWKISDEDSVPTESDLVKLHHAFLVIQSTLLKHIAMAHFVQPLHIRKRYFNHNERVYWLHDELLDNMRAEFKENFETLDRMYRLLRNYGTGEVTYVKRSGVQVNDSWLYSDVHSDVARASIELKIALNKCTSLDLFLDSCANNKQELDLVVLNNDIDDLIDGVTKSLNTVQNSQIRLKKLQSKFDSSHKDKVENSGDSDSNSEFNSKDVIQIGDEEPVSKDEVYYCIKTEDDDDAREVLGDVTTGPGRKEKEATKVLLKELKRKLVKREDVMRERERRALGETMPELRDNIPDFPRQMSYDEAYDKRGFITKLVRLNKKSLFNMYKISHTSKLKSIFKKRDIKLQRNTYSDLSEVNDVFVAASRSRVVADIVLSVQVRFKTIVVVQWLKLSKINKSNSFDSGGVSDGLSDAEVCAVNKVVNEALNGNRAEGLTNKADPDKYKFSKKDLELTPSSSDSEFDDALKEHALLNDVRRNRVARRKRIPQKRGVLNLDNADGDESMKPMEYRFGTGMAMASVLQVYSNAKIPAMAHEEIFIGDGEVSDDSGNDD